MRIVVDSSVVIDLVTQEGMFDWCFRQLATRPQDQFWISAMSITEAIIHIRRIAPNFQEPFAQLRRLPFDLAEIDSTRALATANAKREFPSINLGDAFVYALAKELNATILTLDADFLRTDLSVIHPTTHP